MTYPLWAHLVCDCFIWRFLALSSEASDFLAGRAPMEVPGWASAVVSVSPISAMGFSWLGWGGGWFVFGCFFFSFHRLQEHLENECMSAAWLLVFSDVLGHHCHLLSAEVTTKQFDLSLCTSDRPLSGLDFPNKMICRQSEFCHDLFVAGRRAKRKTEGPVFNCLLPVSNLSGTSLGRQKKTQDLDFSSTSSAQAEQFICVAWQQGS